MMSMTCENLELTCIQCVSFYFLLSLCRQHSVNMAIGINYLTTEDKLNKNKDCIYSVCIIAFNISLISSIKTKLYILCMHYCIQYITYKLNKNKDCIYILCMHNCVQYN